MLKIKVVGINARYVHSCLSLFYVRNELEKHIDDCNVEICHYTINDPYYILVQRLCSGDPDYFFFSSAIWNSDLVIDLIKDLLDCSPDYHMVVGGPQAEIIGQRFADSNRVTTYCGSIEGADEGFYKALVTKSTKQIYRTRFFTINDPWFDFPYREEDFSGPLRNRHIYYESSRGCPFSCSYCLSSTERGLFHKPLNVVFTELATILSHKPKVIRFIDRTFNDVPARAHAIWKFLHEQGAGTLCHFEIAPDRFTEEMFELLETVPANRFQFEIGIQSTHEATLQAIKRPVDSVSAARNIRRIRALETIHIHADLILGLPFETEKTFRTSLNDIFSMRPHYIQVGLLKILPDTLIASQAEDYGYCWSSRPPYGVYSNRWIDADRFRSLYWHGEGVEKFVNTRYFITIWSYLERTGADRASFFDSLATKLLAKGYFWKAITQERLSSILSSCVKARSDHHLISELLCYDWLRCGHRYLPDHLINRELAVDDLRRTMFKTLPEVLDGFYDKRARAYFFKKGVFYYFSREAMQHIGYEGSTRPGIMRFSSEREDTVLRLHKVQKIPDQITEELIETLNI